MESARRSIFDLGLSVGGELEILKEGSWTLTRVMHPQLSRLHLTNISQNAYHTELRANPAELMPPDLLHDWELGVGKAVFTHNLRIFHATGGGAINLFDAR